MDKGILFQIEKAPEASGDDITCHVLSFEDAVTQLSVTKLKKILTIET